MALTRLISPDGEEVVATETGVDALKELGYKDAPKPKQSAKKDEEPGSEAALKKMKLAELVAHAEEVGVDAETLEELQKPGTSKAQVIEAITAATADSE